MIMTNDVTCCTPRWGRKRPRSPTRPLQPPYPQAPVPITAVMGGGGGGGGGGGSEGPPMIIILFL